MRVIFILIVVVAFSCAHAEMCDRKDTRYYRHAELNQFPAKPSEPISSVEANQLEIEGSEYYVHVVCNSGDPVSLTKRWNNKLYFEIRYLYKDDQLIGQKSTNANGETNEYYID